MTDRQRYLRRVLSRAINVATAEAIRIAPTLERWDTLAQNADYNVIIPAPETAKGIRMAPADHPTALSQILGRHTRQEEAHAAAVRYLLWLAYAWQRT